MGSGASVLEQEGFATMEQRYRSLVASGAKDEELFEMFKAILVTQMETAEMQARLGHQRTAQQPDNLAAQTADNEAAAGSTAAEEKGPLAMATSALASVTASLGLGGGNGGGGGTGAKNNPQKDATMTANESDLIQNMSPVFTSDVVTDPITLRMFIAFCDQHEIVHGADRLRFWVEVEELHALPSHSYTLRRLRKIYDKFISPEANSPVCVSSAMATEIAKALDNENVNAGVYAEAQSLSLRALEESVYPRFRESKLFRKMVEFCMPMDMAGGDGSGAGAGIGCSDDGGRREHGSGGGAGMDTSHCMMPGGGVTGVVRLPPVTTENMNVSVRDTDGSGAAAHHGGMKLRGMQEDEFSLQAILEHPAKSRFFKSFCVQALALENLLFYLEVEDCKRLPNLSFITNKTRRLYERYCQPTSKNFIDVEPVYLEELHQVNDRQGVVLPKMFIPAQTAVLEKISEESWPLFCRSKRYLNYTQNAQPDPSVTSEHTTPREAAPAAVVAGSNEPTTGLHPSGLNFMRFVDPLMVLRRLNRDTGNADAWNQLQKLDEVELIQIGMSYPAEKLCSQTSSLKSTFSVVSVGRRLADDLTSGGGGGGGSGHEEEEDLLAIILNDPYAKKIFHQFLQKRGTGDDAYLAVCEEIEEFKLLPGTEYLQLSAKKIYRKYMMPKAKLQVDMSTQMRDEVVNKLSNPTLDMFKKIVARVKNELLQDSLPRFLKSSQYLEMKKQLQKFHKRSSHSGTSARELSSNDMDDAMGGSSGGGGGGGGGNGTGGGIGGGASVRIEPEVFALIDQAAKGSKLEMMHLDLFLNNQTTLHHFKMFLQQQHCSENLLLYEEVENFRRLPSYQIVVRSAKKLYDKYLAGNNESNGRKAAAVRLVCISDGARERVAKKLENSTRTTFDEIERECYEYIRQNLVSEFLDSKLFMALVGTWSVVSEDYPAEMLRGEFEMAFLRHRFHFVQESRRMTATTQSGRKSLVLQQQAIIE